jgi:response regulator RpfG family c-di-GMP phosphodiesterase
MIKTILTGEIRKGMFVILPTSWFQHPFLSNKFKIKTDGQIEKIRESGFKEVSIDTSKGFSDNPNDSDGKERAISSPRTWSPDTLCPKGLKKALNSQSLPPEKKSKIVYFSSRLLVKRLLEDPKVENIKAVKTGIAKIVDLMISDDAMAKYLLTITAHDCYTYTHSVNVGFLSTLLSKSLFKNAGSHNMHELGAGFFLHDIGKVRIDQAILNKQGALTDAEMKLMRTHPYQGYKILSETNQLSEECRVIVMQHHERVDGTGYPNRLQGGDIHLYGKICSIADVYDALTSQRSYKKRLTPFEALQFMRDNMLSHFQRDLFENFVLLFR